MQLCQIQQPSRPIDINLTVCTNINFQSVIDEHDLNAYPMVIANFLRRPLPVAHRTITLKRNGLMSATAEELQWAREIKTAATAEEGLEARSDFEYLHHAIVAKGNVKKALKRIERLQAFREQYDLKGFEEDEPGKLLRACNDMFPAFLGAIGVDDGGRAVQFCEYKNFDPKALKGEKEWRDMMGSFYYMFQAMNAYPDAIRKGIVFACLCKGMGWKNFSLEVEKRAAEFYQDAYPVRMKHIYLIEAPMIVSLFSTAYCSCVLLTFYAYASAAERDDRPCESVPIQENPRSYSDRESGYVLRFW